MLHGFTSSTWNHIYCMQYINAAPVEWRSKTRSCQEVQRQWKHTRDVAGWHWIMSLLQAQKKATRTCHPAKLSITTATVYAHMSTTANQRLTPSTSPTAKPHTMHVLHMRCITIPSPALSTAAPHTSDITTLARACHFCDTHVTPDHSTCTPVILSHKDSPMHPKHAYIDIITAAAAAARMKLHQLLSWAAKLSVASNHIHAAGAEIHVFYVFTHTLSRKVLP